LTSFTALSADTFSRLFHHRFLFITGRSLFVRLSHSRNYYTRHRLVHSFPDIFRQGSTSRPVHSGARERDGTTVETVGEQSHKYITTKIGSQAPPEVENSCSVAVSDVLSFNWLMSGGLCMYSSNVPFNDSSTNICWPKQNTGSKIHSRHPRSDYHPSFLRSYSSVFLVTMN